MTTIRERNSVIELLRIVSVIGIVGLHFYGQIKDYISFNNIIWEILYCDIFCMSVPFFIIISGYYSVGFNYEKLAKLHMAIVFYAFLDFFVRYKCGISVGAFDVIKSFLPIVSYKYWYYSCYFLLLIFSWGINNFIEQIPQKMLLCILIGWMAIVCSLNFIPTFGFRTDDFSKMLFYYVAGRYLRLYGLRIFKKDNSYLLCGTIMLVISYMANLLLTFVMGKGLSWFANDYFIFKEVTVIMLFYYMTKKTMNNSVVNRLASYVPFVYMGEESVRRVLFYYTDFSWMYDKCGLIFVVILLSTLISLLVGVVELIRRFVFVFFENRYVNLKKLVFFKIKSISGIILDRICYH